MFRRPFSPRAPRRVRLGFEPLEARDVPAVTLLPIADQAIPNDVPIFLPVTVTNTPDGPVTTTVSSSSPQVAAEVVTGGRSIRFDLSGTDNTGAAFSGSLTVRLFESVAPLASGRIIQLANSGYYNGKLIHRVINDFMLQGGSSDGFGFAGSGQPSVPDEFDPQFRFVGPGLMAMANAGDDGNDAQFFITDIDVPLASRPQHLNFNHTIVGILTDGFDVYQKAITTQVSGERPVNNLTITSATILTDTENAVLKLTPQAGFTGTATIQVNAADGSASPGAESFSVTAFANPGPNNRPFIGPLADLTTVAGVPVRVTVPVTDVEGDPVTLVVRGADFTGAPVGVKAEIDQATRQVTLTPEPGASGPITLKFGVRDQTDRTSTGLDSAANFDTQTIRLTVNPAGTLGVGLSASTPVVRVGSPVVLTATLTGATNPVGEVEFLDGTQSLGRVAAENGRAVLNPTFATVGTRNITARFFPPGATTPVATSSAFVLSVSESGPGSSPTGLATPGSVPIATGATIVVEGSPAGGEPRITVRNVNGTVRYGKLAFEQTFTGGVRVAVGDVTGDGVEDVIVAPGPGGGPLVKVFDSTTGAELFTRLVFEPGFNGGLYVDAGDALSRGYAQIIVGAGRTGGPRVAVVDAKLNAVPVDFFAGDPASRAGVTIDLADLIGGKRQSLVTGAIGTGGQPRVAVFDPANGSLLGSFATGPATTQPTADAGRSLRTLLGSNDAGTPTVPAAPDGVFVATGTPAANGVRPILYAAFDADSVDAFQSVDPTSFIDPAKLS